MHKYSLTALAASVFLLSACEQATPQNVPASEPSASISETVAAAPVAPQGRAFESPLPQGVVLQHPHHARQDRLFPKPGEETARRTEHEFLVGDASQAMVEFAEAMTAAGFYSKGPKIEDGVVRQVFAKYGYGHVNARAQSKAGDKYKNPAAKGFVVIAWPSDDSHEQALPDVAAQPEG